MRYLLQLLLLVWLSNCTTAPKLDAEKIRPWQESLFNEYPKESAALIQYSRGPYELSYLAARHSNDVGSDTLNLVDRLFQDPDFKVVIIEPIPYSSGESPKWFLDEALQGRSEKFIRGAEPALTAIYAWQKKIPFFGGEPDHQTIYAKLKEDGFQDQDILGFYLVRQIPQWVREQEPKSGLIERKGPEFIQNYCRMFSVANCPSVQTLKQWYRTNIGHELVSDVSNEEVAPILEGKLITQKISSKIGFIRDRFTLNLIQEMLAKYQKVAVVYGASHFITLRKSFDPEFETVEFIEDKSHLSLENFNH